MKQCSLVVDYEKWRNTTIELLIIAGSPARSQHNYVLCNGLNFPTSSLRIILTKVMPSLGNVSELQVAAERSPLFGKLINSKPKNIRQMFFYFWKVHRMPFYINVF